MIKNRKYIANKKNGGNVPTAKDPRVTLVAIGCGKCIECRKQESRKWQVRLLEEIQQNKNGKFITLTFSNASIAKISSTIKYMQGYELDNEIATKAVRLFLERWRKKYKKSIRHWFITELGHNGTENIHIHGIIWTDESLEEVEKIWQYGHIWKGEGEKKTNYVNEATVNYITKYITKIDEKHKYYKSKVLTSPGIGNYYTKKTQALKNKFNGENTNETYRTRTGHKISLPIYYRNKIYTEEEREKLWIQKLDKQERWVCGMKISIRNGEEEYYKVLRHYRKINHELGYGSNEKDWNQSKYELERRIILQHQRTKNAFSGKFSKRDTD